MRLFPERQPPRPEWHSNVDKVISTIEQNEQADPDFYRDPNALRSAEYGFVHGLESANLTANEWRDIHSNASTRIHSNIRIA